MYIIKDIIEASKLEKIKPDWIKLISHSCGISII